MLALPKNALKIIKFIAASPIWQLTKRKLTAVSTHPKCPQGFLGHDE